MEDASLGGFLYVLDDAPVEPLALALFDDASGHAIQEGLSLARVAWVGEQRGDERRSRGCQGSPRWPDVQG